MGIDGWWDLAFPKNSQLFMFLGKMYFTAVCLAVLVSRAVWARMVPNNPSTAKSKFQAE